MTCYVYIIYSSLTDKYYIGQTHDLRERLVSHNEKKFKGSSTSFASDWELFYTLECPNRSVALKIESHIKKNRNRTYYSNLAKYSEIGERLLRLYHLGSRHVLDNRFCLMHICR